MNFGSMLLYFFVVALLNEPLNAQQLLPNGFPGGQEKTSGENTPGCAAITRQCQRRCPERVGEPKVQYVRWTVNVIETVVTCVTKEAEVVPLSDSGNAAELSFNVPCCNPGNMPTSTDPITIFTQPTVAATTATTRPTTTTETMKKSAQRIIPISPDQGCTLTATDREDMNMKLNLTMVLSGLCVCLVLVLCVIGFIASYAVMTKRKQTRKQITGSSDSVRFEYKKVSNNRPNTASTEAQTDISKSSKIETPEPYVQVPYNLPKSNRTSRPRDTNTVISIMKQGPVASDLYVNNNNHNYKPKFSDGDIIIPRISFGNGCIGSSNSYNVCDGFDSNFPERASTVIERESDGDMKRMVIDKRYRSMPTKRSPKLGIEEDGVDRLGVGNLGENYRSNVYSRLVAKRKKARNVSDYSLLKRSARVTDPEKIIKAEKRREDSFSSSENSEEDVVYANKNKERESNDNNNYVHDFELIKQTPKNRNLEYVDIETAYASTKSPKTKHKSSTIIEENILENTDNIKFTPKSLRTRRNDDYAYANDVIMTEQSKDLREKELPKLLHNEDVLPAFIDPQSNGTSTAIGYTHSGRKVQLKETEDL